MDENVMQQAADVTAAILTRMGVDAQVRAEAEPGAGVRVVVDAGEADGVVIGHRGETLASLQHLVNSVVNKEYKSDKDNITIDVGDYQERRRLELVGLAGTLGASVRETRRDHISEMLPASERRVVHQAVADLGDLTSFSLGDGQMKRMVIALADEAQRIVVEPDELLANAPRSPRREFDGPRGREGERSGRGDSGRDRGEGGRDRGERRGGRPERSERSDRGERGSRDRGDFPPRDVPASDGRVRDLIKADQPRPKSTFRIVSMPAAFQAALDRKDADDQK